MLDFEKTRFWSTGGPLGWVTRRLTLMLEMLDLELEFQRFKYFGQMQHVDQQKCNTCQEKNE